LSSSDEDVYHAEPYRQCIYKPVAIVILNKDNADGLRKTLESLTKQSCPVCECYDIYIFDGGSIDDSKKIAEDFAEKINCIRFVEQKIKGGTGPARIEAVKLLREKNYKIIIWGDSENVYDKDYIKNTIRRYCHEREKISRDKYIIISGRSVVKIDSIWSRIFFWYHIYHQIFPRGVGDRHAPGNNKAVETDIYKLFIYPPCIRSEDFIFSYFIYKNFREKIVYLHEKESIVLVSMPQTFKEIIRWQRSRVRGVVECSRIIGLKIPPDFIYWLSFLIYNVLMISLYILTLNIIPIIFYLTTVVLTSIFLYLRSLGNIERSSVFTGFLGYIGLVLHSIFTTYYVLKYIKSK